MIHHDILRKHGNKGGGGIVTDSLVHHLDAGDPASYPGTGSTWFDLSPNPVNATKAGNEYWSPDDGGKFVFPSNSRFNFNNALKLAANGTGPWTLELIFRTTSLASLQIIFDFRRSWGFPCYVSLQYGAVVTVGSHNNSTADAGNADGNWKHLSISKEASGTQTMRINGVNTHNSRPFDYSNNINNPAGYFELGDNAYGNSYFIGDIAISRMYIGKALTLDEHIQNWDVTKGRFGY